MQLIYRKKPYEVAPFRGATNSASAWEKPISHGCPSELASSDCTKVDVETTVVEV